MFKNILLFALFLFAGNVLFSQEPIEDARERSIEETVTIKGIVTTGDEFGTIRYVQDETAGIAVYSSEMSDVKRGDSVTITGKLKEYNQLLEIDPVTSVTVHSSNNVLPEPTVIEITQIGETFEGMLVKIEGVTYSTPGVTVEKATYEFTKDGETGNFYGSSANIKELVTLPTGEVDIVGVLSQYHYSNPTEGYQLLPRDPEDVLGDKKIFMNGDPSITYTADSVIVTWETTSDGTTEAFYGSTPELGSDTTLELADGTEHELSLNFGEASEFLYVKLFSVAEDDTAEFTTQVFIAPSESTGEMTVYFNSPVDNSVATGTEAQYLENTIDDTLINYIERAEESIDMAIYNLGKAGVSSIATALNEAHDRGVQVRVVYCGSTAQEGLADLDNAIPKNERPDNGDGIMHNKFVIIDANSADANKPLVWTGSTNFTSTNINSDPNDVIIIQDKSLALAYQLEFNEMFGSEDATPNAGNALFGENKTNNTPVNLIINDVPVELYFSPKAGVNNRIIELINSADHELFISCMIITRTEIANAIIARADAGVDVRILTDNIDPNDDADEILSGLGKYFIEIPSLHHKYMIVDPNNVDSDPLVLTGCHNWSASADSRNDENTLVVYDAGIANQYFQEFSQMFGGNYVEDAPELVNDTIYLDGESASIDVLANDVIPESMEYTIKFVSAPLFGFAHKEKSTITYTAKDSFEGMDSLKYAIYSLPDYTIADTASIIIISNSTQIDNNIIWETTNVYPNPTFGDLSLMLPEIKTDVYVYGIDGKSVMSIEQQSGLVSLSLEDKGMYFVKLINCYGQKQFKVIVQ